MRARVIPFLLLFVAVAVGYGTALRGDFVWDDRIYILDNIPVREGRWGAIATQPVGNYYRPVVFATFGAEFSVVGAAPSVFHATNLVLHAFAACLLFAAAQALGAGCGVALAGSLLFALHPMQSEAVFYVSGRTDVLGGCFALGALLLHARGSGWQGAPTLPGARLGAALAFALSLGCKESLVALPLAFALGDRSLGRERSRSLPASLLGLWPYALVLVAYTGWRASLAGEGLVFGGAEEWPVCITAPLAALASYARLLVIPVGMHLERFVSDEPAWRPLAGLLLVVLALAGAWRARPVVLFWMAWAGLAYLPTSNLMPVYPGLPVGVVFAPEHFLYLPSMGLLMAFSLAAAPRLRPRLAAPGVVAILLVFTAILHDRARDWRDEETLYTHTLEYTPASARIRLNLGNLYLARGQTERAADEFMAGLAHHADDPDLLTNAGLAWMSLERFTPAERALRRVVALEPDSAQAWANLAALFGTTGRWVEARQLYANALARDPENLDARSGMRTLEALTSSPGSGLD